jgi:surface protein
MRRVLKGTLALFTFAIFSGIPFAFSALESFSLAPANAVPLITTTCSNPLVSTDGSHTVVSFKTVESCTWTPPAENLSVEYLIVAGGGGGGAGGGGAGGLLAGTTTLGSVSSIPIAVGAGGSGGGGIMNSGGNGGNSQALGLTAIGGGGGGGYTSAGRNGGSGGGNSPEPWSWNLTTQPAGTAGQGNAGGLGSMGGGGGGGAGAEGTSSTPQGNRNGGNGGDGVSNSITGTATYYAGGGGGMCTDACANGSQAGLGGGGKGSNFRYGNDDTAGLANTGGGGGGADGGSNGGSGVVIVRFLTSAIVVNDPMILTATASPSTSMVMNVPLYGNVTNITIDWGDGTTSGPFNTPEERTHTYSSPGTYTVTIGGTKLTHFGNYCSSTGALTAVQSFGDLGLTDLSYAFCGASNLTQVPTQIPSGVTSLEYAFLYASTFNQDISTWNTGAVTSMVGMFRGASSFNNGSSTNDGLHPMTSSVGGWNTSNVVSFGEMFLGAGSFNQNVSSWDTANATNVSMFSGASKFNNGSATNNSANPLKTNGNKWDVSKVTNFAGLFSGASDFNQDISNWNVSNATNMGEMFRGATKFNQDISSWRFPNVTDLNYMFVDATAFNNGGQPLTWDMSRITSMYVTFANATSFNANISSWNVSNMVYFNSTFSNAAAFNADISNWDVSSVSNMSNMFLSATSFNQDLGSWNLSTTLVNAENFLAGTSMSVANYDALLNGWATQTTRSGVIFSSDLQYTQSGKIGRDTLTGTKGWTINDAGLRAPTSPLITTWPTAGGIVSGQRLSDVSLTGGSASVPGTFAFANPNTVPAVGSATHEIVFTPTDTANYTTVTSSGNNNATVVVSRATPIVTIWPSAGGISSGQSLSAVLLTAGQASVPGSFSFANLGTVPAVGSASHQMVFTPTDTTNYLTVTSSGNTNVTVVVSRAIPAVTTWPSAASIVAGQALSDSALTGGKASIPGAFTFANPGTSPAVGSASHQVVFTPTDITNFTTVSSSGNTNVSVLVAQAQPVVTRWPSVGDLISGQSLTDVELTGGQANVPGKFTLANPGNIVSAGNSAVEVIFVPNDSTNYVAVASSIQVTVLEPTPTPEPTPEVTPTPEPTPEPTIDERGLEVINPVTDAPLQVAETTVTAVTLVAAVSAAAAATTAVTAVAAAAGTAASAAASAAGSAAGSAASGAASSASGSSSASSSANSSGRSSTSSSTGSSSGSSSSNSRSADSSRSDENRADKSLDDELLELKKIRSGDIGADLDVATKWGDNLPLWSTAAFIALDKPSVKITHRTAPTSPFSAKLIAESAYLRAALGSAFMLLPIASILAAIIGLQQVNGLFLPPEAMAMSVILVIGVLDGFAGLLGMLTFSIGLIINPSLNSPNDLRMLLGLGLIGFAPGMLASAFRNLRRPEAITSHQVYERVVDLVVAPFLAGWATLGIISALPALAGVALPIQDNSNALAVCAAITMFVRVLLEELAVKYFPNRSKELNPTNLASPSMRQKVISLFLRMGLFFFVSMAFVGHCWQLYAGTIIFIIPSFVGLFRDKFPNYPKLYQILPSGLPGLGFALLIASASLVVLQSLFGETPEFAKIAFVLLPIPGLLLSLLGIIGRAPHEGDVRWYMRPKNLWIYRLGGVLVLIATLRLTNII